jgi:hypothetical protein
VIHVWARDGHGKSGAAAGAPPWFTCERWGMVPVARDAGGRETRYAMRAGVGAVQTGMELRPDRRCLWSGIWRGAKGVACVGRGCGSCVLTSGR